MTISQMHVFSFAFCSGLVCFKESCLLMLSRSHLAALVLDFGGRYNSVFQAWQWPTLNRSHKNIFYIPKYSQKQSCNQSLHKISSAFTSAAFWPNILPLCLSNLGKSLQSASLFATYVMLQVSITWYQHTQHRCRLQDVTVQGVWH